MRGGRGGGRMLGGDHRESGTIAPHPTSWKEKRTERLDYELYTSQYETDASD